MLPFGVNIPATVPQRSEIPEGFMNYPVHPPHVIPALKWKEIGTCPNLQAPKQ